MFKSVTSVVLAPVFLAARINQAHDSFIVQFHKLCYRSIQESDMLKAFFLFLLCVETGCKMKIRSAL